MLSPSIVSLFAFCWAAASILDAVRAQTTPPSGAPAMVTDFSQIVPSPNISWTPCYNDLTCARLQVPLDYDDPSRGTAAIAMIRIAAATQPAPNVLFNPGGPGISGIGDLFALRNDLVTLLGTSVNIIGFDPRGVNNTTPLIDCFPGQPATRSIFQSLYFRDVSDASSASVASMFYNADALGKWCSNVIGGSGPNGTARFAGTAAVARDMLTYAEAEQRALGLPEAEAKVWYYGVSYGTILGATFASMFPNRIGRMILDGVMDAEDYYNLQWKTNLADADKVVQKFFDFCFEAGPERCAFWGPSSRNIQTRFDKIVASLKRRPIPAWRAVGLPQTATYTDLKRGLILALYNPLVLFPFVAAIAVELENGIGESLAAAFGFNLVTDPAALAAILGDASSVIPCVDGFGKLKVTSVEAWQDHANYLMKQSRYVGDAWGHNPLDCVSMDVPPPASAVYRGPLPPSASNTSFPIVFLSNTLDPVTPFRSAQRMSKVFPGSVLVAQNGIGHGTFANPSACTARHVQAYLNNATIPASNITCEVDEKPFMASANVSVATKALFRRSFLGSALRL